MRENPPLSGRIPLKSGWFDSLLCCTYFLRFFLLILSSIAFIYTCTCTLYVSISPRQPDRAMSFGFCEQPPLALSVRCMFVGLSVSVICKCSASVQTGSDHHPSKFPANPCSQGQGQPRQYSRLDIHVCMSCIMWGGGGGDTCKL